MDKPGGQKRADVVRSDDYRGQHHAMRFIDSGDTARFWSRHRSCLVNAVAGTGVDSVNAGSAGQVSRACDSVRSRIANIAPCVTTIKGNRTDVAKIEKLLEQARGHLDGGEKVLAAVQGTYEAKMMGEDWTRAGIFMATQTRVVFYAKKMGGYDLESFTYDRISSFEQSKSMMGHSISFFASGNKVHMKWINDPAAMTAFVNTVKSSLNGTRQDFVSGTHVGQQHSDNSPPTPPATAGEDIIGTIQRLGELNKAGIVSDEEFAAKKSELLARL